jgi:hypothetical protein
MKFQQHCVIRHRSHSEPEKDSHLAFDGCETFRMEIRYTWRRAKKKQSEFGRKVGLESSYEREATQSGICSD